MKPLFVWIMFGGCLLCLLLGFGSFVFVFSKGHNYSLGSLCTTPNGESALCKPWYDCSIILDSLVQQQPRVKQFAEASKCGETPLVCCGSKGHYADRNQTLASDKDQSNQATTDLSITISSTATDSNATKDAQIAFALEKLLPTTKYCGLQHTDDYFYDKNETSLDEFPWLVYIPFGNSFLSAFYPTVKNIRCTGFLISNRYAITERFCGSGADAIEQVYIGQYQRDKSVSCVDTPDPDFKDCTEPLVQVKVTESFYPDVHSVYISNVRLLRLENKISYSDYVRPICLPLIESTRAKVGDTVVTSGWGAKRFKDSEGKIKKRYKHTVKSIELEGDDTTSFCVSPQNSKNTICQGDDGGPVMYSYRNQWFAEAVLSLDDTATSCDDPNEDACAVQITPLTIEWILLNIKP